MKLPNYGRNRDLTGHLLSTNEVFPALEMYYIQLSCEPKGSHGDSQTIKLALRL